MSETGFLWYDDDPARDLAEKAERAIAQARAKYGEAWKPTTCYVHPSATGKSGARKAAGVPINPRHTVLPHHFWVVGEGEVAR